MKYVQHKSQLLMMILVVGFFIGILYENVALTKSLDTLQIFEEEQLEMLRYANIKQPEYIFYIIKMRSVPILAALFLWNFRWRKPVLLTGVGWAGFICGRMLVAGVIGRGARGILLCLAVLFPHFVFYVCAYLILILYLWSETKRRWKKAKTAGVLGMFLTGLLLEIYINPIVLNFILKWV